MTLGRKEFAYMEHKTQSGLRHCVSSEQVRCDGCGKVRMCVCLRDYPDARPYTVCETCFPVLMMKLVEAASYVKEGRRVQLYGSE